MVHLEYPRPGVDHASCAGVGVGRGAGGAACLVSVSCVALHHPNCGRGYPAPGPGPPRGDDADRPGSRTPRRGRGQAARRSSLSSSAVRKYNCLSTSLQHAAFAWALRWRIRMAACIIMLKLGRVTRRRPRIPERPAPATLGPAPAGPPGCPPGSDSNLCSGRYG